MAKYTNVSADALVRTGGGTVSGIIVNSHSSGTFKLYDGLTSAGTLILNTYTPASGSSVIEFPEEIEFYTGLYFDKTNAIDATIVWSPNS